MNQAIYPSGRRMRFGLGFSEHPDFAVRIANVIARWNTIEDLCSQLLDPFVGATSDHATVMFAAIQGGGAKIGFLKAAGTYALSGHPLLKDFEAIVDELARLNTKVRIPYVHSVYAVDEKGKLCILNRRYDWREDRRGSRRITLKELDLALLALRDGHNAVARFHNRLMQDAEFAEVVQAGRVRQMRMRAGRLVSQGILKPRASRRSRSSNDPSVGEPDATS